MASLASYTTLYVTAVRVDGAAEVGNIAAVRWHGDLGPEESSVADFVRWLERGQARAFVEFSDGTRGPRVRVDHDDLHAFLSSRGQGAGHPDALLLLPRWRTRATKRHATRT